jgi:hypothetical protein
MIEDAQYEQDEFLSSTVQHQRWSKAMEKEQANFDKHDAFQYLPRGTPPPRGYQRMRCHFVFDVKSDGKFKARFCAGGDSVDATGVDSAMTVVETPSTRILFVVAEANSQRFSLEIYPLPTFMPTPRKRFTLSVVRNGERRRKDALLSLLRLFTVSSAQRMPITSMSLRL